MAADLSKLLDLKSFFFFGFEKMLLSKDLVEKCDIMLTLEFLPIYI